MPTTDGVFVIPSGVARDIRAAGPPGGLVVRIDESENLALVIGFRPDGADARVDYRRDIVVGHYTNPYAAGPAARCHAADANLHAVALAPVMQSAALSWEAFKSQLRGRVPPGARRGHYLTYAPDADDPVPTWLGWVIEGTAVRPFPVHVFREDRAPHEFLGAAWPLGSMTGKRVAVIGVGSIGSAAADALAGYAVGQIDLVDHDRLLQHNLTRHLLTARDVGRRKAYATAERLRERRPGQEFHAHDLDVVSNADRIRELLSSWDAVVIATDGVESRLAANWLTARARVPAVFACVLEDGAIGEILRSRYRRGCLLCHRMTLRHEGVLDPEPQIDLEYGTGTAHRPMTAVGSDLALVGQFAAKVAVATLLEHDGYRDQRIPGDHAVLALRPDRRFAAPFDDLDPGETRWSTFEQVENCHVCDADS